MGKIFVATATPAERGDDLLQNSCHIVRLARRLREDERGLRCLGGEKCDDSGRETCEFLGEKFYKGQVTMGKNLRDYFAAICFGSFG